MIWDWKRCFLHMPVGMFQYWLIKKSPVNGVVFSALFGLYELNEDKILNDEAYIDIQGILLGMALGAILDELLEEVIRCKT